jgi:hypothetical protein
MTDRTFARVCGVQRPREKRPEMALGFWAAEGLCLLREGGRPVLWLRRGLCVAFALVEDSDKVLVRACVEGKQSYTFVAHRADVTRDRPPRQS